MSFLINEERCLILKQYKKTVRAWKLFPTDERFRNKILTDRFLKFKLTVPLLILSFLSIFFIGSFSAQAATHYYVRAGANGAKNGSDWNNAYTSLPSSLQRGATYWIADGHYSGYTFDDAPSGSTLITVKKATVLNHGTSVGWQNSYGDGQAHFNGTMNFRTSYWVFDGQTRNENDWTDGDSYGFHVYSGYKVINTKSGHPASNVEIAYSFLEGHGPDGNSASNDIFYLVYSGSNWWNHHNFIYNAGRVWVYHGSGTGSILHEYNYFWKNESTPEQHAEGFQTIPGCCSNSVARYNVFREGEGTGTIVLNNSHNWKIYGNIFLDTRGSNGVIAATTRSNGTSNTQIYNNTFVDSKCTFFTAGSSGTLIRNNILYNCTAGPKYSGTQSHNITSANFVDYSRNNFRLSSPTSDGYKLDSGFNKDMDGTTRGSDGIWDIGAYDFNSGDTNYSNTPSPPENLRIVD